MQEGLACWPSVPDFSHCFSPNQWNAACWDQGDEHWLDKNSCSEENFSSQSYSCGRKLEVHRTKYSDLYCFVCKAAVIGAYLNSQVCHHPGYTQSCHAWSQHWRGACSSQGIPSRCKQMSDVPIPTHPKNSTMLPKNTAMLLLYRLFTLPPRTMSELLVDICEVTVSTALHQAETFTFWLQELRAWVANTIHTYLVDCIRKPRNHQSSSSFNLWTRTWRISEF